MKHDNEKELLLLEQSVGQKLNDLPGAEPDAGFEKGLWEKMMVAPARVASRGRSSARVTLHRSLAVAAVLVITLGLVLFGGVNRRNNAGPSLGPLFIQSAQASPGQSSTGFRLGVQNAFKEVKFSIDSRLGKLPRELPVQKLKRPALNPDDALGLARRLGIDSPELAPYTPGQTSVFVLGKGESETLSFDLIQGSMFYEAHHEFSGNVLTADEAKDAAVLWLDTRGLLPEEPYTVTAEDDPGASNHWVNVIMTSGPDGRPITGTLPGYRLYVTAGGGVANAYGAWYPAEGNADLPIMGYRQALDALKRGEGEFLAEGFSPFSAGQAVVKSASVGYQLAYALDYTPYLVPVAVFSGEYSGENGAPVPFTANVCLLQTPTSQNAGNFILETGLPTASDSVHVAVERPLEFSAKEVPELSAFFGNGEIRETSWDGGWLWRGTWQPAGVTAKPLSNEQATAAAKELARKLPVLPGTLGDPELIDYGARDVWVKMHLFYDGVRVHALNTPADSDLAVQVDKSAGTVISVNCAKPMQLLEEERRIITPEQAWQKLLKNEGVVHLDYLGDDMPAENFLVEESRVTEVHLGYMPRYWEMARNEYYDLKYFFQGIAKVGDVEFPFTAIVDAE